MLATILIACTAIGAYPHEAKAARADFEAYGHSARYLDMGAVPETRREEAINALRFTLPHLSRAVVIDHQRPVRLPGTDLYRIDIDSLLWGDHAWETLAKEYPYWPHLYHGELYRPTDPLIIRGDWLLRITADANESDAYYTLLYAGTTQPKTRADFLKVWAVRLDDTADLDAGTVIGPGFSGVANEHNFRLMRHARTARGDFYETFDSANTSGEKNPFENLPKGARFDPPPFKFDAGEQITTIPKLDIASGKRGTAQVYFLTDGRGNRVNIAEGTIVTDHQKLFGISQIRTPGSCFQCHAGLNGPRENYMRDAIADGVELTAKDKRQQEFLDRFYLTDLGQDIAAGNESFAAFVEMACGEGVAPGDAVADWKRTVESFDEPLSLEQAAVETASDPNELRRALAYYSEKLGPARIGLLAHLAAGRPIDRDSWEATDYARAVKALDLWRKK